MPNAWITHVKEFSDKKKMKYTDALKSQECKDAYKEKKPKSMDEMKQDMQKVIVKTPRVKKMKTEPEPLEIVKNPRVKTMKTQLEPLEMKANINTTPQPKKSRQPRIKKVMME